jgi:hypothetical protein
MIILSGAGDVQDFSITTPSDLASIWEWWEPSREAFSDNDLIGTLTGQVSPGSGHNFTQSTSGEKPTYKASILNSLGVARFDGVDNWLHNVNPSSLSAAHVFIVVKKVSQTTGEGLWDLTGNNPSYGVTGPAGGIREMMFRPGGLPVDMSSPGDLTAWNIYEIISTASEYTVKFNGTTIHTSGTNYADGTDFRLGNNGPFFTGWFNGDVAGLYICSAKLGSGDRTAMVNYLNNRFALTAT